MRKKAQVTFACLCVACLACLVWQIAHSPGKFLSAWLVRLPDGRRVESEGFSPEFDALPGRSPDYWPSLLNLKVPPGARELDLALAVTQGRFAEFVAKPEQSTGLWMPGQ